MKKLALFLAILATTLAATLAAGSLRPVRAAVYNLHLVTDNGPDDTDFEAFVRSVTERWETPQEKCIAVWRWGRRSRRQTSCADDDGRLIWDPILHYNSYGTMNCGVISGLNIARFLQLGYQARYLFRHRVAIQPLPVVITTGPRSTAVTLTPSKTPESLSRE